NNGRLYIENVTRSSNMYLNVFKVQSDKQGTIWGITNNGVIKVNKNPIISNNYIPKVLFTVIRAGATDLSFSKKNIELPYDQNNFLFQVATPSFYNENEIRYSFMLQGSDDSWSAPSSLAEINYVNLPPGKYTLNVR